MRLVQVCASIVVAGMVGRAQQTPAIQSISICSPTGAAGQGSCPAGSFDTHQIVLGPDGTSINRNGAPLTSDEHSSVFAPGTLGSNKDYLFFVATQASHPDIGMTVLSGGAGPAKNGQWTFDFARVDGYGSYPDGFGQVFQPPLKDGTCPTVADGNPAHQDQTFDLEYAAPGSVMKDPTGSPGALLMVYEGVNGCIGSAGGQKPGSAGPADAYITLGIATSLDYGKTWPSYRGTPTFSFVQLPEVNQTQGPNAPTGALGRNVCVGNDCSATPPANYGRYPVVSPPTTLASLMAAAKPITGIVGNQEISGFVDDAANGPVTYLYALSNSAEVARAALGGNAPLTFQKWNGQGFNSAGIGGTSVSVLPKGVFENCLAPAQSQFGSSISYVEETQQYLLTFVCRSPGDPALGPHAGASQGAAWFYSTNYDLSDQTQWSTPREITGSWSEYDSSGGCPDWKGFYPTFMSLGKKPGHLSTAGGYVFYLWGCQQAGTPPPGRQFSSRAFTITTGPAAPTLTAGSLANGATYLAGGLVPGSWAQAKGTGLSTVSRIWSGADFTGLGNNLPTKISGVQVNVNNLPAAVYFVDPGQVSFQVPAGVTGTASVQVVNNGVASNAIAASSAAVSPGIFPVIVNGVNYAAGVFTDGKYVGDPANGTAFRKAKPGEVIQLYATGLTAMPAGVVPVPQGVNGVAVTMGGTTVTPDFAGLVAVGEFQINFKVPAQLADGVYPVIIAVNGVSSPASINTNPAGPVVIPVQH